MKNNLLFSYILVITSITIAVSGCSSFTDGKGFGINYDRRTAGTIVDDQGMAIRVGTVLTRDKELWKNCHLNTLSYNGTILLVGQAPTDELKDRAARILYSFIRPEQIYNQITIETPTSLTVRTHDSWITTQVKGKILGNKHVGVNRTKVITENGVVYLMGILTKEEEEIVTNLASQTKDVKQVIKIITEHQPCTGHY